MEKEATAKQILEYLLSNVYRGNVSKYDLEKALINANKNIIGKEITYYPRHAIFGSGGYSKNKKGETILNHVFDFESIYIEGNKKAFARFLKENDATKKDIEEITHISSLFTYYWLRPQEKEGTYTLSNHSSAFTDLIYTLLYIETGVFGDDYTLANKIGDVYRKQWNSCQRFSAPELGVWELKAYANGRVDIKAEKKVYNELKRLQELCSKRFKTPVQY